MNRKEEKNKSIQGLRGIASCVVFLGHFASMYSVQTIDCIRQLKPINLCFDGSISVVIFFVLSGFYICKQFDKRLGYWKFIYKRSKRLLPEFWISCVVGVILCNTVGLNTFNGVKAFANGFWQERVSVLNFIKYLFLVGDYKLINPPTWTVRIEVNIMVFYGALMWGWNKLKTRIKGMKYNVEILVFGLFGFVSVLFEVLDFPIVNFHIMTMAIIGAVAQKIVSSNSENQMSKVVEVCLIVVSILMLDVKYIFEIENEMVNDYIMAVGAGIVVVLLYKGNYIKRCFSNAFLVWMGNCSYEFYLFHFLILLVFRCLAQSFDGKVILLITFIMSAFLANIVKYSVSTFRKNLEK
ncbi:acyltransferase family protein [Butyrivibrio sp. AE3006]|uniref:acyltransferase family protein n=1 Tax=Butyrivibrio sp. AE3006 TaxID=1280673 RepID=UPI000413AAF7|nr:acyltransferase [Butyrivibrio sp. AE3006]